MVEIERGSVDDVDALRELWLELHHHHAKVAPQSGQFTDDETSWAVRSEEYRAWLADARSFVLLARDAERLVGYCLVRVFESGADLRDAWVVPEVIAEVETVVVSAEARGRGLGSRLMDAAEAELERAGITQILIGLIPGNDGARRLYERRGYRPQWLVLARS